MEYIPDERDFTKEVIDNETYGLLRREITYLSDMQRKIIVLHYFHDKKVREIAQLLSLFTRIMEELLNMGVLKEPTAVQKKGLCTIMFLGE